MTYRQIKINILIQAITAILAVMLFVLPAKADWTKAEIGKEVAWGILHVLDWGTTLDIADNGDDYCEVGLAKVFIGSHPTRGEVNIYMGAAAILHPIAAHLLPNRATLFGCEWNPRAWFQNITIIGSGACVANNFGMGLRLAF